MYSRLSPNESKLKTIKKVPQKIKKYILKMSAAVDQLPQEVIAEIFRYLPLSDKLQANLVCRQWHEAFVNPLLHDGNTKIAFIDDDDGFLEAILNSQFGLSLLESNITFGVRSLYLWRLSVSIFSVRTCLDWSPVLGRLKELTLSDAAIVSEAELVLLLSKCVSLTSLAIHKVQFLYFQYRNTNTYDLQYCTFFQC